MTSSDPESLALQAEREAEAAQARAEAARARAEELRKQLPAAEMPTDGTDPTFGVEPVQERQQLRQSPQRMVAVVIAALLTAGLLAATTYMLVEHHEKSRRTQQIAEYAAAARQGLVNLMSIDYATADDSVQRVLDGSTGRFRTNFEETADEFVKALKDEKIVTKATVNDAAVESMTDDSAVVLLSATSRREGQQAPKDQQEPRLWRVVLTLQRDGGQIKMSSVEFV
jgi:Mce-associated membrane protein